jgi:glycosyl-4,4'-diaponeurosporenoate acyltransferase
MLPLWNLPAYAVVGLNVVAAAAVHAGSGYAAHRLSDDRLRHDGPLLRLRAWELDGDWYRRGLRVDRWKDRLPEAGDLFAGGLSKRRLPSRDAAGLARFERETRRAERAHWWAMLLGPLAVLWNPPLGSALMVGYACAVNAPFIAVQRYNRGRIQRLRRRATR